MRLVRDLLSRGRVGARRQSSGRGIGHGPGAGIGERIRIGRRGTTRSGHTRGARRSGLVASLVALAVAAGCSMQPAPPDAILATIAAGEAGHPTTAIDAERGTVYVAWVGAPDATGRANVYLTRSDDGGASYAEPVRVNDIPGDAAPHAQAPAQVATGPDGTVYVAWQNNTKVEGRRFPASDLRLARSTDGGRTFEPAVYVNDDAGGPPASHTFHDLAVLPDGTVLVSWIDGRERAARDAAMAEARSATDDAPAAGASAEDGAVADTVQHATLPAARHAASSAGVAAVDDVGPQIRVARSTDGGRTFGENVIVAEGACPCCRTALTVAPDGTVYLAWRTVFDGGIRDIVVARSDDGGRSFHAATPVHDDGWRIDACPHAGPSLAVDGTGRLHAAWFTGAEGASGVFHATSSDGGRTFGAPVALASAEIMAPSQVKMRTDASGLTISGELGPGEDDGRDATLDVVVDGALLTRIEVPAPPPGRTTEVTEVRPDEFGWASCLSCPR